MASRQLDLQWAEADLAGPQQLPEQHAVAPEELRELEPRVAFAGAALQAAQGQSRAAHAPVEGVTAEHNPAVQEARASFLQAWIAASRATVRAPVAGYLARRNVQAGQQVSPGQSLFTIVPLDKLWVEANFKEGQLRALRIGQPVRIDSDLYGGAVEYHGRIAGVGVGTGAAHERGGSAAPHRTAAVARRRVAARDDRHQPGDLHGSTRHHDRERIGTLHRRDARRKSQ